MLKRIARPWLVAGFLAALTLTADAKPLKPAVLEAWLGRYGAAWEARDPALAGALFTADAVYQETPFDEPKKGRAAIEEYWRGVTADQRDVQFDSKVIAVTESGGVVHWSARFKVASSGATIELDGVFLLEFDAKGQCTSLREWWHVRA